MTSEERRERRYRRRQAKRKLKLDKINKEYGSFEKIANFDILCDYFEECKKSVSWKSSTQKYEKNLFKNVYNTRKALLNGTFKSNGFHRFTLNERGKIRKISSVHVSERVIQKTVTRECLLPILSRSLIYDNGASLKFKGIDFHHRRLTKHLRDFYSKYKQDGYILLIDFSCYFDNILHEPIFEILSKKIYDTKIIKLMRQFVDPFGEKGLGLGSETSQILAINYPNPIDHYIKEVLRIKGYGRYMDDSYLIHHDKKYLKYCLEKIIEKCNDLGIVLNIKKTQIIKLTHQFTFLKIKYNLLKSGKIIKRVSRPSITRMRRKMKKFKKLLNEKLMTLDDIECSYQSWKGYLKRKNNHNTLYNLEKLYNNLFSYDLYLEAMSHLFN